jgi:hypothetical protein
MRYNLFTAAICCLVLLTTCRHHNNHNTSVSISESNGRYRFHASFPERQTGKIHRLINNRLSPNGLFASTDDYMDITTTLQDNTSFAVKAAPGIVEIKIDRQGNSPASYARIKDMCAEIKTALKD